MTSLPDMDLEGQIGQWRSYLERHPAISGDDLDELEHHLRDQVLDLQVSGLADDEAFLVAVRRIGNLEHVSHEFARENSERLWKQLVLNDSSPPSRRRPTLHVAIGLAIVAAAVLKLPSVFGLSMTNDPSFYLLNASLFVLPLLAGYFAWDRGMGWRRSLTLLIPGFLTVALVANAYPLVDGGVMQVLVAIHLPVFAWFVVGIAYTGGDWRSHERRMDYVRFTGEWIIYYTLIALGGAILIGLALAGFAIIGVDAEMVLFEWILPCGAVGAVIISAWLVETKQNVIENIAPVLTAVFTPLTTVLLLVYLGAIVASGNIVEADRELLILADLILVLVLGLVLYSISARDPRTPAGLVDAMQLVLIATAVAIDLLMLIAMSGRIAEFGATPNKVAALGLNLILLVNLAWSARLVLSFLRRRRGFSALERWQTTFLPVFFIWTGVVVVALPLVFGWE